MDAWSADSVMSNQALASEKIREGLQDILLEQAHLYEALRARGASGLRL
jgi:type I restriction enzyme R subunit